MGHKPQAQLAKEIADAKVVIKVGAKYSHYKDQTKTYEVLDLAVLEADDSVCVLYQAQYGDHYTFVRPVSNWLETVIVEGEPVPRFSLLS